MDLITLKTHGVGRRQPDDDLFQAGDKICRMYVREGIVDISEEQSSHSFISSFPCHVPNCAQQFSNVMDYELHNSTCHRYICAQCKKQLFSSHLLDLHLSEKHDSFFLAQAIQKPMYSCFVEDCTTKSNNAAERKTHCIEVHNFPHYFRFDESVKEQNEEPLKKNDCEKLLSKNPEESLKDEPKVASKKPFTFGHGKQGKTFGQQKPWHKRSTVSDDDTKQSLTMDELMETLPVE